MSEPLPCRFQIDERHGDGPWVTQYSHEATQSEIERIGLLFHGVVKALDDGRLKGTGGSIRRLLIEGVKGGVEEGAQELAQRIGENLIAADLVKYDPKRQVFEGAGDATGVGFTVGTLFNVIAAMLGARMRSVVEPEATDPTRASLNTESQPSGLDPLQGAEDRVTPGSTDEDTAALVTSRLTEVGFEEAPLTFGQRDFPHDLGWRCR